MALANQRLDYVAAELIPAYSRARLQHWIKQGCLTLNGRQAKPRQRLQGGEHLQLQAELVAEHDWPAQAIPLDIHYQDDSLIIINKPAGLIVHPGAGAPDGTLLNALLYHFPSLKHLPRAGIVHRLDKDTTGLMVVARQLSAQTALVQQLQQRTLQRHYIAIAQGQIHGRLTLDNPIGRHPSHRTKMAVVATGKPALTHVRAMQSLPGHTLLQCQLHSGRTHQIRVHLAAVHHPLLGDALYNNHRPVPAGLSPQIAKVVQAFPRQALHAQSLQLIHPQQQQPMRWQVDLPEDLQHLLHHLNLAQQ